MEPDGRRGRRVPVEVAEVAQVVDGLVDALQRSGSRQRELLLSGSRELRTPLTGVRNPLLTALSRAMRCRREAARSNSRRTGWTDW